MSDYINVKKELTKLLEDASMDTYVGLPAKTLAEYLINEMDKLKRQMLLTNRERANNG